MAGILAHQNLESKRREKNMNDGIAREEEEKGEGEGEEEERENSRE